MIHFIHLQLTQPCVEFKIAWIDITITLELIMYIEYTIILWRGPKGKLRVHCSDLRRKTKSENVVCIMSAIFSRPQYVNPLWPSDTIWQHKSESTGTKLIS